MAMHGPCNEQGCCNGVEVKDDIECGIEGSEHPLADGRLNLNDKVGRTSPGEQGEAEAVGASAAKPVHADEQIQMCGTDQGETVE